MAAMVINKKYRARARARVRARRTVTVEEKKPSVLLVPACAGMTVRRQKTIPTLSTKFQTSGGRRPVYALRAAPRQAAGIRIYQEKNLIRAISGSPSPVNGHVHVNVHVRVHVRVRLVLIRHSGVRRNPEKGMARGLGSCSMAAMAINNKQKVPSTSTCTCTCTFTKDGHGGRKEAVGLTGFRRAPE